MSGSVGVRRGTIVLLAACLVVASACTSSGSDTSGPATSAAHPVTTVAHPNGPSAGCRADRVVAPGTLDTSIESGGRKRSYLQVVPEGYDGREPLPLIFALHSLTIDYHVIPAMSGLSDAAKTRRFIMVAPSGLLGEGDKPYWNAAPVKTNHDVTFMSALLDHLEASLCIDTAKVFSLGMSNGAQMSSLVACRLDGRIAAIGAISGVEYNQPCPTPPTAVIAFHGTEDPFVPFDGGGLNSVTIAKRNYYDGKVPAGTPTPPGVEASMAGWARHNRCDPTPTKVKVSATVERWQWNGCAAPTELYVIAGGGHAWPGICYPGMEETMGRCTDDIEATPLMMRFLLGSTG